MSSGLSYSAAFDVLDKKSDFEQVQKGLVYLRNILQIETTTPTTVTPSKVDWSRYDLMHAGKNHITKMMCPRYMASIGDKTQALMSINSTLGAAFSQSFKKKVDVTGWIEAIEAALYRIVYKVESDGECPRVLRFERYSEVKFSVYRFIMAELPTVSIYIVFGDDCLLDYFFSNL